MKNIFITLIIFVFSIQINAQPANNTCATATPITDVGINFFSPIHYFNDIETATIVNETLCADPNPQDYVSVWYDVEMPINGNLLIDGYQNFNHFEVYDACGGTLLKCFSNEGVVFGLTQSTHYKLRIFRTLAQANYDWKQFRLRALTLATNNDCASAETLSLSTSQSTVNFNVKGSTSNNTSICGSTTDYVDVWYDFTLATQSNILISSAQGYNKFAIYDACAGTEVACFSKGAIVEDLVAGNYKLRLYRTSNYAFTDYYNSFTISAHQSIANDVATASENITVTNINSTVNFDPVGAALEDVADRPSCLTESGINNPRSIWYHFTMPFNGNVYIEGSGSSINNFEVYNADATIQLNCFTNKRLISNLVSGTEYKIRVYRTVYNLTNLYYNTSFTIRAAEIPANDACSNAITIPLTETLTTHNFSLTGTIPDTNASCSDAGTYHDVWFDFTMPTTPSNLYIKGRPFGGNKYAIYDTCNGAEVACFNYATTSGGNEILTNLTAGTNYKLRVYRVEAHVGSAGGLVHEKFEIRTYPKIDNTSCATATNITVTETNTFIQHNLAGANLLENEMRCTSTDDYYDAWYTFTMPVSGNLTVSSTGYYNYYELFDACAGNSITCSSGNTTIQNLVAGNTYKLRVSRNESNLEYDPDYNDTFRIVALAIANNDTCGNAENITVSETENTVNFEIISAQLNTEEGCSGSTPQSYADVWYKFTMPSFDGGNITQGNVLIDGIAFYNKFAIYNACGGTEIDCFEDSKIIENLTSGTNYKIRVYRTAADYTLSSYKSFTIKAFADAQNDNCSNSENITVTNAPTTINFELGGAAPNLETICGTENTYADVWYDFTVPEAGNVQITTSTSHNRFEILDACAGTQIGCFTGGNASFTNLVSGTNYKLRVFRKQINNQDSGADFDISFQSTLGVNDFDLSNKVKIYPNPASDVIHIQSQLAIDTLELYDVLGKKVLTSNQTGINISRFETGVYFLKIIANEGELVKRIVIK